MDKKEFINQLKASCHTLDKSVYKECEKVSMCNWNMCQKEIIDVNNAILTDEERKSCENKKDFLKQFACQEQITKKKQLMDKIAMVEHCRAKKCPQTKAFFDKMQKDSQKAMMKNNKQTGKKNSNIASMDKCLNETCGKEKNEVLHLGNVENNKNYECKKTYKTWKEQTKCIAPYSKKTNTSRKKLNKCRTKHCSKA